MAYSEDGRKSRSTNKKRVTKYKASKGADFNDDTVRSIKTKTKYDKEGEIKKIKRVKKTEGGGKMITVSKPGLENNSLSPEGATGLVTTRERKNRILRKDLKSMAMTMGKVKNPITYQDPDIKAAKKEIRKGGNVTGGSNVIDNFGHEHGYQSDKTKELDNSRLVTRKRRQDNRSSYKFNKINVSKFGKEQAATPKEYGGSTKKEGKKIARQLNKEAKQEIRSTNKSARKRTKANRIIAKI